ncbi:MAG: hypothetical protein AB1721_00325 [Patescibacteria group bacterium]
MGKSWYHILRVGLGIVFFWIGVLILKEPELWAGFIRLQFREFLPESISLSGLMIGTAIFDLVIGFLFLIDWQIWLASLFGGAHLLVVIFVAGINETTIRDIGLLAGALALLVESSPNFAIEFLKTKIIKNKQKDEK